MGYKVIKRFKDTDGKVYEIGNSYKGTDERINVLSTDKNKYKTPFIEKVEATPDDEPKHVGGGWYELPNGEKVKGKENALNALDEN